MNELELGLSIMDKVFSIFKVFGVLGIGLTAFGIYMIVCRSKSKHNGEPTADGTIRKQYKKFPIVGIVFAMWFGIAWMISGLIGAGVSSVTNSEYFKEQLQEAIESGDVTMTVNGEQVVIAPTYTPTPTETPTPVPTKEVVAEVTLAPTVTPTPAPTVPSDELFEATLKFGINGETLTLKFPKEWGEDAYVTENIVSINYFEDVKADYSCCFYKKGTTEWMQDKMEVWKEIYEIDEFAFANELEIEGATDKSYIFGWDTEYGSKKVMMYVAGSLDNYLEIAITDYSDMSWEDWQEAINLFIVKF